MVETAPQVTALIEASYAPGDIVERGNLQVACDSLQQEVSRLSDSYTAQLYMAHVLQELRISDLQTPVDGNVRLEPLLEQPIDSLLQHAVRFLPDSTGRLAAQLFYSDLPSLEGLPGLDRTYFQDKTLLIIGMGGGSDIIQGAANSELFSRQFGSITLAFGSVRKAGNRLLNAGQISGSETLKRIHTDTAAQGQWRYLENMFLADNDPLAETPMYIINSAERSAIERDIRLLADIYQPDIILGVDTGGDSLATPDKAGGLSSGTTDSSPDQDLEVIDALQRLARCQEAGGEEPNIMTSILGIGVDSPSYARQRLQSLGSFRLPVSPLDRQYLLQRYKDWRMDGSGNAEGRYGKTALALQAALAGKFGLQLLDLPVENIICRENTWRTFLEVTPAMGELVLTDIRRYS